MLINFKFIIFFGLICPQFIKSVPRRPINSDFVNGQWARIGKRNQPMDFYMARNKKTENFVTNSLENYCSKKAIFSQHDDDFETYFKSNFF